jgi:hypothetical protein
MDLNLAGVIIGVLIGLLILSVWYSMSYRADVVHTDDNVYLVKTCNKMLGQSFSIKLYSCKQTGISLIEGVNVNHYVDSNGEVVNVVIATAIDVYNAKINF